MTVSPHHITRAVRRLSSEGHGPPAVKRRRLHFRPASPLQNTPDDLLSDDVIPPGQASPDETTDEELEPAKASTGLKARPHGFFENWSTEETEQFFTLLPRYGGRPEVSPFMAKHIPTQSTLEIFRVMSK